MADEKKPEEKKPKARKKPVEPEAEGGVLVEAAKAIGAAAGKIASLAGVEPAAVPMHPKSVKPLKLQKKNKSRLPRKQKKALRKGTAAKKSAPTR
jgi:hypothetical protein